MADVESLKDLAAKLHDDVSAAYNRIGGPEFKNQLDGLAKRISAPDFWSDQKRASEESKQHAKLEARLMPWLNLISEIEDNTKLLQLADEKMTTEIENSLSNLAANFNSLKEELKFAAPHDDSDAILSIHAGAGGTDAQDWAEMLERMYLRWAEKAGLNTEAIDRSAGDEAGIKSTSFYVSGNFVYGRLKGEHGVHRLVRLSPFNADSLRQTSFAKVEIMPKVDKPDEVMLDEKDLKVDVYRSGGKGGQSVNTTDSAVRITHTPTGITVAIQNERSQLQNKETAMTILRSKLAQLQEEQHASNLADIKGPNEQAAWGNQIRNYVLHPYKMVKDTRTGQETSDVDAVLDGNIDDFINAYLDQTLGDE